MACQDDSTINIILVIIIIIIIIIGVAHNAYAMARTRNS